MAAPNAHKEAKAKAKAIASDRRYDKKPATKLIRKANKLNTRWKNMVQQEKKHKERRKAEKRLGKRITQAFHTLGELQKQHEQIMEEDASSG
jgi:CII-binding regulator of phage lambda lysogenization HflD